MIDFGPNRGPTGKSPWASFFTPCNRKRLRLPRFFCFWLFAGIASALRPVSIFTTPKSGSR